MVNSTPLSGGNPGTSLEKIHKQLEGPFRTSLWLVVVSFNSLRLETSPVFDLKLRFHHNSLGEHGWKITNPFLEQYSNEIRVDI